MIQALLHIFGSYLGSQNVFEWWKYTEDFSKSRREHIYHWGKINGKLATHRYPRPACGDNGGKPERAALQKVPGKDSETGEDIATLWCQLTMFDAM